MSEPQEFRRELASLREVLRDVTARVYRLERILEESAPQPVPHHQGAAVPPQQGIIARAFSQPVTPQPTTDAEMHEATSDLETRIGSHWLNRIGISAVLIGIAYFLKFAFDNNWIGASGRVVIGIVAGIGVVLWSERFRARGYRAFSFSLKAVGIGALYLSFWAAFQVYSLIPASVAFVAMLIVTASTAVLALTQDAQVLAAFALTGGFATPALLSTGQNREWQLFSYVLLLDIATVLLIALKPWRRLLLLSFGGTLALYIAWYATYYTRAQISVTLAFATLFFATFAIAPLIAYQMRETSGERFAIIPHAISFLNAIVYFLEVYAMMDAVDRTASAWFALALAVIYIFLSRQAQARGAGTSSAQTLHFLHLALAIGFLTIAIPIRLEAHWITIGWFVESAVLLWVAGRLRSDFLNALALIALALGTARLLVFDDFATTRVLLNARAATYAIAIGVLGLVAWFGTKRSDERGRLAVFWSVIALNLLALTGLSLEVNDYYARQLASAAILGQARGDSQWLRFRNITIVRDFTYSFLWMGYGALLMVVGFWKRSAFVRWQALILVAVTVGKVFTYDVSQLDRVYRILSFIALGVLLLAISFAYQRDWFKLGSASQAGDVPTA